MPAVKLPVHLNPGLETECYHNFRLSMVMADPDRLPWCYGHYVNLQMKSKEKMRFPFVRFEEHLDIYSSLLQEQPVDCHSGDWLSSIREAINNGHYGIVYLNWKHLPCSNFYNKENVVHDALIYGYDDEARMLDLLAFEVNGKSYDAVRLSYETCERELAHVLEEHMHANKWFAYYGFPLSTVKLYASGKLPLNLNELYFALERGQVHPRGSGDDVFANGYPLNAYMASYFAERADDRDIDPREYGIWNIVVTKMLQHKKWMLHRFAYMSTACFSSAANDRLLQKCQSLYTKSKQRIMQVRMDSLKYQKTADTRFLLQLANHFQAIGELEKRAVPLLMEYLIEVRLDPYYEERRSLS